MKYLLVIPFLVGCSDAPSILNDAGDDASETSTDYDGGLIGCRIPNAQYAVSFTQTGGDCQYDGAVDQSYIWVDQNGVPQFPYGCTDWGIDAGPNPYNNTDVCITHQSEWCYTWITDLYMSGSIFWTPDGKTGTGDLVFSSYSAGSGVLSCSAMYHTVWQYQWEAASN